MFVVTTRETMSEDELCNAYVAQDWAEAVAWTRKQLRAWGVEWMAGSDEEEAGTPWNKVLEVEDDLADRPPADVFEVGFARVTDNGGFGLEFRVYNPMTKDTPVRAGEEMHFVGDVKVCRCCERCGRQDFPIDEHGVCSDCRKFEATKAEASRDDKVAADEEDRVNAEIERDLEAIKVEGV